MGWSVPPWTALGLTALLTVTFLRGSTAGAPVIVSVLLDADTASYRVLTGTVDNRVAWANFSDQISDNGWSFLRIVTNASYPDGVQAYAAGLAEGHLTTNLLYYHWMNTVANPCEHKDVDSGYCERLWNFLHVNREWMKEQIAKNAATDPYWHQVDLLLKQIQGLQDGCQNSFLRNVEENMLQDFGFLFFNMGVDITSLQNVLNKSKADEQEEQNKLDFSSALIKVLTNNTDLYVGHTTWLSYNKMLRILKKYEFFYHQTEETGSPLVPGGKIAFSSYPGLIFSLDDYHLISSGLLTMETTLQIANKDLWKYVQPTSLLYFLRVSVANRLANDGQGWTNIFFKNNMGTYNNQWMVIDYNKFRPGESYLNNGLLWVAEQLPGITVAEDRTSTLRRQTYWASYNMPYFEDIYSLSHNAKLYQKFGDFYSYENTSRALIFKRDHHKVVNLTTALQLMRYNDYVNDPLSLCANCTPAPNAMNAIAGRGDLNPSNGTYPPILLFNYGLQGAIDTKVTNLEMFSELQFAAWAGPTDDQQRPFRWSATEEDIDVSHMGHPDLWHFKPVVTQWE